MNSKDEKWALFWCSLLHPVIFDEVEQKEVHSFLENLCQKEFLFPDGKKKKPSLTTLKRKLKKYKSDGFEALSRKNRSDKGKSRTVSQEIIDKAIEIKKEVPQRSANTINIFLKQYYDFKIPTPTLYRYLKQHGATRLKLGYFKKKVRCRWTRDNPHELWIGDFSKGPYVLLDGNVVSSHISLFIDCYSRYVVEGRYYLKESLDILIDSLLRAWTIHGVPRELYVDNAKIYHSNALKSVCYALKIKLIHRKKGDPAPGGLVERMFGTAQSQFETEVKAGEILTLDKLNKAFSAWLNIVYHETVHSEIKQPPKGRLEQGKNQCRKADINYIIKFFMKKETRIVHKDFSDVSINNRLYSVNSKLRGDKVIVRYDPYSIMDKVLIYSPDDHFLGNGVFYNREKRNNNINTIQTKPKHNYIDLILKEHEKRLFAQAKGIDYIKLLNKKKWPFASFTQKFAELMGIKGGISGFTSSELENLKKIYNKHKNINEYHLLKAFEKTQIKTIGHIALALQKNKEDI